MKPEELEILKLCEKDIEIFALLYGKSRLRRYQVGVAHAVIDSVLNGLGRTFVVIFPRQSGKNWLQAQIEAFLLVRFSGQPVEIVKVSPTYKPQTLNAMRRLQQVLEKMELTKMLWVKESGYIIRVNEARVIFLSGSPTSNVVGATASTLLECDEAQDVQIDKWDKDFAPMASSTNATRLFWGTAWTSRTLLARELRLARQAEAEDGAPRAFVLDAAQVAREAPAYGRFVDEQVSRLGRTHPMIRTQYFSEEIDADTGMFPQPRRALMQGEHPRRRGPESGRLYALLIDVAGEFTAGEYTAGEYTAGEFTAGEYTAGEYTAGEHTGGVIAGGKDHDATALTVVEVDLSSLVEQRAPVYRCVDRRVWVGAPHTLLFAQVQALAENWRAVYIVVDATGVGAGLASFLQKALPGKILPFIFTSASKSKLGWDFLSIVETGRFRDWRQPASLTGLRDEQFEFWRQVEFCQMEVAPGPENRMRWGVPDGLRDPATGELVHDDLLVSAALCAVLEVQPWGMGLPPVILQARDPLLDMDERF